MVIYTNIRSVVPKITELSEILKLNRADIATITATLCRDHIPDAETNPLVYLGISTSEKIVASDVAEGSCAL